MANLSKMKRDEMIAFLNELKKTHSDDASIRAFNMIENHLREKKYGLVWEEHSEEVDELLEENIPVLTADPERRLCKDESLPWNFIIEGDNLQALYLLEKTHRGKVDCIYIDPPYNTGAKDWKYNNDYVGKEDEYRHSKWLSMMKNRLLLAKHLLNQDSSVLIVTIDEKEYLRLGCLLEEIFPEARIQMVSSVINHAGSNRVDEFARSNEYIFFVKIGTAVPIPLALSDEWRGNTRSKKKEKLVWNQLMRSGTSPLRINHPLTFYPLFVSEDGKKIVRVGEPLTPGVDRHTVKADKGTTVIWPIRPNGDEGRWNIGRERFLNALEKGYIRLGKFTKTGMAITYLKSGEQEKVEAGVFPIIGYREDGSVIEGEMSEERKFVPGTQWDLPSHNATYQGSQLLNKILGESRFSFPKSLYAVHDAIRFFVSEKSDAVVVDFFAGSGTTMHAVNLLNAEDGGNRTCIMVTNNEISEEEAKGFEKRGIHKGDKAWEERGIAKYVTWQRTICTINGVDVNGNALKGNYLGKDIPMSDGFKANVKFFKCGWTPRKPEDYLLSNALCLHIREMIELQNAIEVDNVKNCLILNKSDLKKTVLNPEIYSQIQNIWVNQNIIFNAEELRLLEAKGYKYIPREFFGQELKEAAE